MTQIPIKAMAGTSTKIGKNKIGIQIPIFA
jgi:hypothetical protein